MENGKGSRNDKNTVYRVDKKILKEQVGKRKSILQFC